MIYDLIWFRAAAALQANSRTDEIIQDACSVCRSWAVNWSLILMCCTSSSVTVLILPANANTWGTLASTYSLLLHLFSNPRCSVWSIKAEMSRLHPLKLADLKRNVYDPWLMKHWDSYHKYIACQNKSTKIIPEDIFSPSNLWWCQKMFFSKLLIFFIMFVFLYIAVESMKIGRQERYLAGIKKRFDLGQDVHIVLYFLWTKSKLRTFRMMKYEYGPEKYVVYNPQSKQPHVPSWHLGLFSNVKIDIDFVDMDDADWVGRWGKELCIKIKRWD